VVPGGPAAGQAAAGQAAAEQAAAEQASAAQASAAQQGAVGGEGEKPLLLRMEPMVGCLTTCEAVARALGALEPQGSAVRDAVLRPLAQLAQFQARLPVRGHWLCLRCSFWYTGRWRHVSPATVRQPHCLQGRVGCEHIILCPATHVLSANLIPLLPG
jgi:hypothetical protein